MDFNKIALEEAQKSKCSKRKVGAIIVNQNKTEVLSRGYNYSPDGKPCEDKDGNTKDIVIHAEIAAIDKLINRNASRGTEASYIYVTHPPCANCQEAIDELNLKVIIVENFMKFDAGKLRYSLIPPKATKELAKVLTYGARKYKPNNWQKVEDKTRYVDALYRHLEAWRADEKIDSESGLSHLSHALTNIAFLIYFEDIK